MNPEHRSTIEEAMHLLSYYASKSSPTDCGRIADQLRNILKTPTPVAAAVAKADVELLLDRYSDAHKALDAIGAPPKVNPDGISVARSVAERIELFGKVLSDAKNSNEEAAHDASENERWLRDAHNELDMFYDRPPRKTDCGTATITLAGRVAKLRDVVAIRNVQLLSQIEKITESRDKSDASRNAANSVLSHIAHTLCVGSEWAAAKPDDHEIVKEAVRKLIADRDAHKSRAEALEQRAKAAEAKAAYGPYDSLLMEEVEKRRQLGLELSREQAAHAKTRLRIPKETT